jgi:hypothetical protein
MVSIARTSSQNRKFIGADALTNNRAQMLSQYFYFFMSLLIPVIVIYGFSHTVNKNLIHPAVPRPPLLYFHAAIFSGWLLFFMLQSVLVRTHHVAWHRRIGWFGVALGVAIIVVGISTAITMARFNTIQFDKANEDAELIVPLFDMVCFTTAFVLAVYWRRKPEFHRRLMFIATCSLTAAAFGRFPERLLPEELFYVGVDALILLGVARDLLVNKAVHRVYLYILPAFITGQAVVTYTAFKELPYWREIAHEILW